MILGRRLRAASTSLVFVLLSSLALASGAHAQARWEWPERAKNLKVLPRNTSKDQLRDTMVGFTRALGVRCVFCHVGEDGKPLSTFDFVSDRKIEKETARGMVRMARSVNRDLKKMKLPPARS